MNPPTRALLDQLHSPDSDLQNQAFSTLMGETDRPVDWAYDAWDELVRTLGHDNNRLRAIAAQILCNLAKSDPENRMRRDFARLLAGTKDERFVTARHTLQSLWKVGAAGTEQRELVMGGLEGRYRECVTEKNATLIRYDILQGMRNLYEAVKDEAIRERAMELIEAEADPKYRKKYASLWRSK
jgi:hypothetical protein